MGQEEEISAEESQYAIDNKPGEVIPARAKEKENNYIYKNFNNCS